MKKLILIAALAMTGCSSGHYEVSSKAMDYTKLNFIGIPTMLGIGMTGSSTPITDKLSLTNKHVAYPLLKSIAQTSKRCDVAVIAQNNKGEKIHQWAQLGMNEKVTFYGYSGFTTLPVTSSGNVVDFYRDSEGCLMALTNAGGVGGMSGGAVVNSKGKLVGIVKGVMIKRGLTIVIPYQSFADVMPLSIRDQVTKDYTHAQVN